MNRTEAGKPAERTAEPPQQQGPTLLDHRLGCCQSLPTVARSSWGRSLPRYRPHAGRPRSQPPAGPVIRPGLCGAMIVRLRPLLAVRQRVSLSSVSSNTRMSPVRLRQSATAYSRNALAPGPLSRRWPLMPFASNCSSASPAAIVIRRGVLPWCPALGHGFDDDAVVFDSQAQVRVARLEQRLRACLPDLVVASFLSRRQSHEALVRFAADLAVRDDPGQCRLADDVVRHRVDGNLEADRLDLGRLVDVVDVARRVSRRAFQLSGQDLCRRQHCLLASLDRHSCVPAPDLRLVGPDLYFLPVGLYLPPRDREQVQSRSVPGLCTEPFELGVQPPVSGPLEFLQLRALWDLEVDIEAPAVFPPGRQDRAAADPVLNSRLQLLERPSHDIARLEPQLAGRVRQCQIVHPSRSHAQAVQSLGDRAALDSCAFERRGELAQRVGVFGPRVQNLESLRFVGPGVEDCLLPPGERLGASPRGSIRASSIPA